MSLVTLIPLFLAAYVGVNVSDWKYGPEVIYDVKFDLLSPGRGEPKQYAMYNTTMKIACQPKSELVLSCTLGRPTTVLTSMHSVGGVLIPHRSKTLKDYEIRKDYHEDDKATTFEINFDPNNYSIVADTDVNYYELDIMRVFVDQLWFNIGAYLTKTSTGCFVTNGTAIGCLKKCPKRYCVRTDEIDEDHVGGGKKGNGKSSDHEIILMPNHSILKNEAMNITMYNKNSDLVLNTHGRFETIALGAARRVVITESTFTSFSDYYIQFTEKDVSQEGRERVTVTLDKIVPASGTPSSISRPRDWSICSTRASHSDLFVESGTHRYDYWLGIVDGE